MLSRSSVERIRELTCVVFGQLAAKSEPGPGLTGLPAVLSFIEVDLEHLRCPQRQVQREPGSRIANVASDQLTDSSQPVGEGVAVDAKSMRGIGV